MAEAAEAKLTDKSISGTSFWAPFQGHGPCWTVEE